MILAESISEEFRINTAFRDTTVEDRLLPVTATSSKRRDCN
jgi:hypothetical protein